MRLVSPDAESATASLIGAGGTVLAEDDALTIGSLAPSQIGDLAARDGFRIYELTPVTASLEDAFMELTKDEVEYRPTGMPEVLATERGV